MGSFEKTVAELNKYNKVFEEVAEESQDNSVSNMTEELQIDSPGNSSDSYDDLTPQNVKVNNLMGNRSSKNDK